MIRGTIPDAKQLVDGYVRQVMDGERKTCRYERYAVERYLADLKHAPERGWYFNEKAARMVCNFFPMVLKHSIGQWANDPYTLSGYQAFCAWNMYGWRNPSNNARRFLKNYICVGRKNGKTTFASGLAIVQYFLDWPIMPGGSVICCATKKPQAALLWHEAVRMIRQSPYLNSRVKILGEDSEDGGRVLLKGGVWGHAEFKPIGADGSRHDGLNPSAVFFDEIHAWRGQTARDLEDKLTTAGGARLHQFHLTISTAGDTESDIWAETHDYYRRVNEGAASGQVIDDRAFGLICEAEEDDDPMAEETWQKANPNWMVSVQPDYLRAQANEALVKPSKLHSFIRYHCNRLVASFSQAYPKELWDKGVESGPDIQPGDTCYGGMDLGRSNDFAAVSLVYPFEDGERVAYRIRSRSWACDGPNSSIDFTREPFKTWIDEGLLELQTGEVLDFVPIRQYCVDVFSEYDLVSLAYDKTFAGETASILLNDYGVPMFEFYQTFQRYTEPILSLERSLIEERVFHGDDPLLRWQAENAMAVKNPKGEQMLDKGNNMRWKKIDAVVALLMGYSECLYHHGGETGSLISG